ncbi:MAG: ABC transporter ATP-binding protein [Lachnospiraceae bacterium]|nr:ABC transporter ATP-binding protein [Lachnospiraceae bacterium]
MDSNNKDEVILKTTDIANSKNEVILKTTDLTKKYGNRIVVDNLNIEIRKGEIFGLLGPNGAGKSTTMNMICNIVTPTLGDVEFMGKDFRKNKKELSRHLGFIPQDLAIHGSLKAWENVELFTSLYGIRGKELKERINESLEYVGLSDKRDEYAKTFSGGMKRRLNIACAIGHHPELLIFDEPTVGIDPQSRNFILEKIKESNRNGATVIYTSHYMEEVEAICTRIAVMDNGKLIAVGTSEELKKLVVDDTSKVTLEEVFLTLTGKNLRDM